MICGAYKPNNINKNFKIYPLEVDFDSPLRELKTPFYLLCIFRINFIKIPTNSWNGLLTITFHGNGHDCMLLGLSPKGDNDFLIKK